MEFGCVSVMVETGDTFSEVQTPLEKLASSEIYTVFGESAIRSPAKQIEIKTRKTNNKKNLKRPRMARSVSLNNDRSIKVGGSSVSVEKLLPVISEFYGFDVEALIKKELLKRN